ncbi:MAG: hypothetical protein IJ695_01330 [Butyrivibrio sp.]|nr:hypothetical protein [Butyrivibrio sp.]
MEKECGGEYDISKFKRDKTKPGLGANISGGLYDRSGDEEGGSRGIREELWEK